MARFVKVASIPARQLFVLDTKDYESCVQLEIEYWKSHLSLVAMDSPDLILTPECCDRPLHIPLEDKLAYYEVRGDRIRDFFMRYARDNGVNIAYGAIRDLPDGTARNSIQLINRQGGIDGIYDKYFVMVEEYTQSHTLYGRDIEAIETDYGRVCGAICFDLNFDEAIAKTAAQHPDIVLFSSAYHGGLMQNYWAYKCRSYFLSSVFNTESAALISPVGEIVKQSSNYKPYLVATVNFDYKVAHLDYNYKKLDAVKDKYGPAVDIDIPFGLGSALLTCNDPALTMADIVNEFEIELLDDYMARAHDARYLPGRKAE